MTGEGMTPLAFPLHSKKIMYSLSQPSNFIDDAFIMISFVACAYGRF
jgi:hypothetical protein